MMDCRQVKQLLPLWVGQDLPDTDSVMEVANHLGKCSDCEKRRLDLQTSLEFLQGASVGALSADSTARSLWPQLVSRISEWERAHRRERFNGWIPASVMALAVALMIAVSLPSIRDEFFGGSNDANVVDLFEFAPELNSEAGIERNGATGNSMRHKNPAVGTAVNFKLSQW